MRNYSRLCLALTLLLYAHALKADVIVTTFDDRNNNGLREGGEPLITGLQVRAYDLSGVSVDFLDNGQGTFLLPSASFIGRVRVVVTGFDADQLRQGGKVATSVFFAEDGEQFDIPVLRAQPLDPNANDILIPCYEKGASRLSTDSPAFVRFPFSAEGIAEMFGGTGPNPIKDASISQIGSTWGVAYQRSYQRAFASTIMKRHVGLGPQGPGAVYVLDYSAGDPTLDFFNLQGVTPSVGPTIDLGTVTREIVDTEIDQSMPYALSTIDDRIKRASYDVDAFDKVGKMAYGSIEMAEDGRTLWMVNLKQRSLISMDVGDKALQPGTASLEHYLIDNLPGIPNLNFRFRTCINTGGNTNVGGSEPFTDPNRTAWSKNRYSVGGDFGYQKFQVVNALDVVENTTSSDLYNTFRKGNFAYDIPVPVDEVYEVMLHFAEPENIVAGDRVFDIVSGDQVLFENFDIIREAGASQKAVVLKLNVSSRDGLLNLKFIPKGSRRNEALVSGIEVIGTQISQSGVLRPWGLTFHEGRGYLGITSDASYSQSRDHLFAYLLSFDPKNIEVGFREELAFPLNYPRERASNAQLKDQQPLRSAAWQPWANTWEETMIPTKGEPLNIRNGLLCAYAQPIFSKISFTSDGSIIVGLMDRWAHQLGHNNFSTDLDDRTLLIGYACGDILKAFVEGNGNYALEKTNSDDGIYYRKDDGPSYQGEFFYEDNYISSLAHHGEVITGGMLILPGSDEIAATVHNPRVTDGTYFEFQGLFSQGLHYYNTNTGRRTRDYVFVDQFILGKANGLGDMVLASAAAPPSVGNYVWCDANGNGAQDPSEYGIDGIRILLQDVENALAPPEEVVSANGGQFFFDDLQPNHCYELKIGINDLIARGFSGSVSPLNATDSLFDSDGNDTIVPGWVVIGFCTGDEGLNRDDLDFGFLGPEALDDIKILCEDVNIPPVGVPCADFQLADIRALASTDANTVVRLYPTFNAADSMLNEMVDPVRVCTPDSTVYARVMINDDPSCYAISQIQLVVQPGAGGMQVDFVELICPTDPFDALTYLQQYGFRGDTSTRFFTDMAMSMMYAGDPSAIDVMGTLPLTLYYDDSLVIGGCGTTGSLMLNAIPTSMIFAGFDTTICGLSCVDLTSIGADFDPNGSGAMDASWSSSGTGTFIDDNSFAFARLYCISEEDLANGQVTLTLSVDDDPCISPAPSSSVLITIENPPPSELPNPRDTIDCFHPFALDPLANDTFPGCRLLVNCVDTLEGIVTDYQYLVGDCEEVVIEIKRTLKFTYQNQDYFCMDTISVRGLPDTLICPPEKDSVYCVPGYLKDENGHPSPLVTGVPMADSIPLWPQPPSSCDILIHYKDVEFDAICPTIIRRDWFIKNTCTGRFDTCAQWIMVFDTTGPTITKLDTAAFYVPLSTSSHDCFAEVYVPKIMVEDTCTDVKQVKAMVNDFVVELTYNPVTGYYESHQKLRLPVAELDFTNGTMNLSYVRYEVRDLCDNLTTSDSLPLFIVDATKPVAICDKGMNLTVSDSTVWLAASAFDEGSWDNCGLAFVLARRTDWATACGVDLCDSMSFLTSGPHHDSLFYAILESDKHLNPVEAHYQKTIDWLCEDGRDCTYPLLLGWAYDLIRSGTIDCREHPYAISSDYIDEILNSLDGDSEFGSLLTALVPCLDLQGDTLAVESIFSNQNEDLVETLFSDLIKIAFANNLQSPKALTDIGKQIGGGWSTEVPFCCEDACTSVMVEVLAMDYWCNWSKCWTTVNVEDKTPPTIVSDLYDVTMNCSSYKAYYAEAVNLASAGEFDSIQKLLGSYDQVYFDAYGNVSAKTPLTLYALNCDSTLVEKDSLVYDEHLGYVWKSYSYYKAEYDTSESIRYNGQVADNCGLQIIEEKPWISLDHCGNGFVKRIFKFVGQCSVNGSQHMADTIKRTQTIWIRSDCEISSSMFHVPKDTVVYACEITYENDGSGTVGGVAAPSNTGQAYFLLTDDCRNVGIGYYDKVFKIVGGDQGCYKIIRTWCFADWCALGSEPLSKEWWWDPKYQGKYLSFTQKIIVQDEIPPVCLIDLPSEMMSIGCSYTLDTDIEVQDACGLIDYAWQVINTKSGTLEGAGNGLLDLETGDRFNVQAPNLSPGSFYLKVIVSDACQNERICSHSFSIVANKKPTPVCITSLTVELNPMDQNNDGVVDTAMAVIWASEFNQSSTAACGSENTALTYRIDRGFGDPALPIKSASTLTLGCDDVGTNLVRMYVLDASGSWDYCSVNLIVQENMGGCNSNAGTGKLSQGVKISSNLNSAAEKKADQQSFVRLRNFEVQNSDNDNFQVYPNEPNPFYEFTKIGFSVSTPGEATLSIYDARGRLMRTEKKLAYVGLNYWEISGLGHDIKGLLYYRLDVGGSIAIGKMIRMR